VLATILRGVSITISGTIAASDGEAIQHSRLASQIASEDMVAVLAIISEVYTIITIQIPTQDGFISLNIPLIRIFNSPSKTTFKNHIINKLK
jgi:hypothetical protein